ncbi:hypothetical protein [Paenibacillus sp. FSL K6-2859]|uniref:hypothetical protein n=1 Tax=Paenibacillus sp. FSL K6-2859 TaxID=2921482 RepID=UPI0030F58D81
METCSVIFPVDGGLLKLIVGKAKANRPLASLFLCREAEIAGSSGYISIEIVKNFPLKQRRERTDCGKVTGVPLVSRFSPLRGMKKSGEHSDWNNGPLAERPLKKPKYILRKKRLTQAAISWLLGQPLVRNT